MNRNNLLIERYLSDEFKSEDEKNDFINHLEKCPESAILLEDSRELNSILNKYDNIYIDDDLMYSLKNIPLQNKKRFMFLNLLPKELAFTAASVIVALFAGFLIKTQDIYPDNYTNFYSEDYIEQISLAALFDFEY